MPNGCGSVNGWRANSLRLQSNAQLVAVPMVRIWHVRVIVYQPLVLMSVGMWLAHIHLGTVFVLMILIMSVQLLVCERLVFVHMRVTLA